MTTKEFKTESQKIKKEIDKAEKILITLHRSPDIDSIGCGLGMADYLESLDKDVTVISSEPPAGRFSLLPNLNKIKVVDYQTFDFTKFDLLVLLDTPPIQFSPLGKEISVPAMPTVVIDHHGESSSYLVPKIFDPKSASCAQLVYQFLKEDNYKVTPTTATLFLAGVYSDTVGLTTTQTDAHTFQIVSNLIKDGADFQLIVNVTLHSLTLEEINLLGVVAKNLAREPENFIWTAIDYQTFDRYGSPDSFTSLTSNTILPLERDALFGFIIIEKEPGLIQISFRSKGKFDTSKITKALGGGGHPNASAARIKGEFKDTVEKVLTVAKEIAKK